MAKKSSNKKNSRNLLFDLLCLIFIGGVFGLLAMPYVKYELSSIIGSTSSTSSGYELLNFEANATVATFILLVIIFASLAVLFLIIKMLADAKIIKNKNFAKLAGIILVVMTFALFALSIVSLIVIASNCGSNGFQNIVRAGSYAGWLGLILTSVSCLFSFILSIFSIKK